MPILPHIRQHWLPLSLLAIVVVIVRAAWIGDANADIDEQLYSLIGNAMLQGAVPYVDLWDRKPLGLFALYAFAHAIGGPGAASYQVLAALFTLAGAWMTYRLAGLLVDRLAAFGAGLLYVFLMSIYGAHSGNSEAFHVPMMLAMAVLVRDADHSAAMPRAYAAMLIGGLALQVKYTVLPQCLFFGLWALWEQYRRGAAPAKLIGAAAGFGALGLLPTILIGAAYAMAGYWDEFIFANLLSFFDRLPSDAGRLYADLALFLMPLILLAVGGIYAAIRMTPPDDRRTYIFFLLWLAASLATVFLPATVYRYYFAAIVPATALVALPLLDRRGPAGIFPLTLIVAGAAFLLYLPIQYEQSRTQRAALDRLAEAITLRIAPSQQCLWIFDGPTSLYRLSGSCLPTRFIYPDHLNNALEKTSLGIAQIDEVARLLATKPPVIVTASKPFTPQNEAAKALVEQTVAKHYQPIAQETLHERVITAWGRKEPTE